MIRVGCCFEALSPTPKPPVIARSNSSVLGCFTATFRLFKLSPNKCSSHHNRHNETLNMFYHPHSFPASYTSFSSSTLRSLQVISCSHCSGTNTFVIDKQALLYCSSYVPPPFFSSFHIFLSPRHSSLHRQARTFSIY